MQMILSYKHLNSSVFLYQKRPLTKLLVKLTLPMVHMMNMSIFIPVLYVSVP